MLGTCKLLETSEELRESHIYPRFVIEYMKTSGSRFLRNVTMPNKREQDGIKRYLLSDKAEQRFGVRENWFKQNIFIPYLDNNQTRFDYDENLFYFSVSFLWRVLLLTLQDAKIIQQPFYETLKKVEVEWREFLRDFKYPTNYNNFHLFFTSRVKSHNFDAPGIDLYMTRTLDGTVVWNNAGSYVSVYGKFMRFIFSAIIIGGNDAETKETKIDPLKGQISTPQNFGDKYLGRYFPYRAKEISELEKPSEKQQKIIIDEVLKDKEKFLNSDLWQSKLNDEINLDPQH